MGAPTRRDSAAPDRPNDYSAARPEAATQCLTPGRAGDRARRRSSAARPQRSLGNGRPEGAKASAIHDNCGEPSGTPGPLPKNGEIRPRPFRFL